MSFLVSRGYIHVVTEVRGTGLSELSASDPNGLPRRRTSGSVTVRRRRARRLRGARARRVERHRRAERLLVARDQPVHHRGRGRPELAAEGDRSRVREQQLPELPLWRCAHGSGESLRLAVDDDRGEALAREHRGGVVPAGQHLSGGDLAYDRDYWQGRTSSNLVDRIVDNGVPTLMYTGWNALEGSTGAVDIYAQFQNRSRTVQRSSRRIRTLRRQAGTRSW